MAELPKQELLIKILGMTTSDNDGQALVAIRKANALLDAAGWTWERLIQGKITIVEDPFNGAGDPFAAMFTTKPAAPAPPRQRAPGFAPASPPPPPNRPWTAGGANGSISNMNNKYVGFCYCCGVEVPAGAGFFFTPSYLNPAAPSKFHVVCVICNTSGTVYANPTGQRPRWRGKANISDLV